MSIDLSVLPSELLPMTVFCLGVYFLTLTIRSVAEARWKNLSSLQAWRKTVRAVPVLLGGLLGAVMYKYPYLSTLPTWGTRFIYGCFGGGVASFAYMVFKAVVQKYFGVKVEKGLGESDAPKES